MRIAVVHSAYSARRPSGENRVVEDQVRALDQAGHEVMLVERRTDELEVEPLYRVKSAFRVATGFGANPSRALHDFKPDVVHVHNLFPNFGSRLMTSWNGPIAMTLHNFRLVCSNGLLYRNGNTCTECPKHGNWRAVKYGCYRHSKFASIPVAVGRPGALRDARLGVTKIITTSNVFDHMLKENSSRPLETIVIPNFGSGSPESPLPSTDRHGWLAMGRFSPEKGFRELLEIWPSDQELTLVGDGPDESFTTQLVHYSFLAHHRPMSVEFLRELLPRFKGLIFPSRWVEAAPQVVVEAARVGLPIIAFRSNGVADLVAAYGAGTIYGDRDTLIGGLRTVESRLDEMSAAAVDMFSDQWLEETWLDRIEHLYASLLE